MRISKKLLLAFFVVFLAGCQAIIYGTASDFEKVQLGMTKSEVIVAIGSPVSIEADADKGEEVMVYKRMKHAISEWARTYAVVLRNGKVVRYGEQYQETNVNRY